MDRPVTAVVAVLVAADLSDHSCLATADDVVDRSLPAILAGYEDAEDADGKKVPNRSAAARSAARPGAAMAADACLLCLWADRARIRRREREELAGGERCLCLW